MKWGLKGGISIDADSGPPRYVLWCCGGICHQLLTFIKVGCDHTVPFCSIPNEKRLAIMSCNDDKSKFKKDLRSIFFLPTSTCIWLLIEVFSLFIYFMKEMFNNSCSLEPATNSETTYKSEFLRFLQGLLVSEEFLLVFRYSKRPTKLFTNFCPRKWLKQKLKALY